MRSRWKAGAYSCTGVQQNCGDTGAKEDPGDGNPEQAEELYTRQTRYAKRSRDADRNSSREACRAAVEKSRYCLHTARTVNRHRWMRRES